MGGDRPGFKPWRGPATVPYKGNAPQVHHPDTAAARLRRDAFERRQSAKGATAGTAAGEAAGPGRPQWAGADALRRLGTQGHRRRILYQIGSAPLREGVRL